MLHHLVCMFKLYNLNKIIYIINMEECLIDMHKILTENNIEFFLTCGTLLGQYRNDDFISYDTDIDFGIFSRHFHERIKHLVLSSNKFNLQYRILGSPKDSLEYKFWHKNGCSIDLFFYYPVNKNNDDYYYSASFYGICDTKKEGYCKWGNHIRGLKQITFKNRLFNIPINVEEFLEEHYGKDWRTPKKFTYWEGLAGGYKTLLN